MYDFEFDVNLASGDIEATFGLRLGKEVSDTIFFDQEMAVEPSHDFRVVETEQAIWVTYEGDEPLQALRYLLVTTESATGNVVPPPEIVRNESGGMGRPNTKNGFAGKSQRHVGRRHHLPDLS